MGTNSPPLAVSASDVECPSAALAASQFLSALWGANATGALPHVHMIGEKLAGGFALPGVHGS